jgi:hypothetical protein
MIELVMTMTELQRAILFLHQGRDMAESQARYEADAAYKQDLEDVCEDLSTAIAQLETLSDLKP